MNESGGWARLTPSGIGVLAATVFLLAFGISTRYPDLVALGVGGAVALAAAAVWTAGGLPDLGLVQEVEPQRIREGEWARARLTAAHGAVVAAKWQYECDDAGRQRLTCQLAADSEALEFTFQATRRGALTVEPVGVVRTDPLVSCA